MLKWLKSNTPPAKPTEPVLYIGLSPERIANASQIPPHSEHPLLEWVAAYVLARSKQHDPDIASLLHSFAAIPLKFMEEWGDYLRDATYIPSNWNTSGEAQANTNLGGTALWLDLQRGSGYVRERALLELLAAPQAAPNSFFLVLALRRMNDWVAQVRQAAHAALPGVLAQTPSNIAAPALRYVMSHWQDWGRIEQEGKDVLLYSLAQPAMQAVFLQDLMLSPTGPTAFILAQLGRSPAFDASLPQIARKAVQPMLRAKAYRFLFEGRAIWQEGREWRLLDRYAGRKAVVAKVATRTLSITPEILPLLQQALVDSSPLVRRVGADFLIKRLPDLGPAALPLAQALAQDRHPRLAASGRFALQKLV